MESIIQFKFCGYITIIKKNKKHCYFNYSEKEKWETRATSGYMEPTIPHLIIQLTNIFLITYYHIATIYFQLMSGQNVEVKAILRNFYN